MRTGKVVVAGALLALLGSGCGTTMRDVPMPGTGVSGPTVRVTAKVADAVNLADGALVKVDGVDRGKVAEITVDDFVASVEMDVQTQAKLRSGATARLRYSTPLGEIFVDVSNPASGTPLADGDILPLSRTETAPTVEDALASASLLINGGGLGQLDTVVRELNTILGGNEASIKELIGRTNTFLAEANAATRSIDRVLTSLNATSKTLTRREKTINRVIQDMRPAAQVLRRAAPDFTRLLAELEDFSVVANRTVDATRTELLTLLSEVQPALAELASNRPRFNAMLRSLVKAGEMAQVAVPGNYLNVDLDNNLDNQSIFESLAEIPKNVLDLLGLGNVLPDARNEVN